MQQSSLLFAAALLLSSATAAAQHNKPQAAPTAPPTAAQRPAASAVRSGLFGIQRQGDDWFFLIPDSLLGRPLLCTTRYVATPVGIDIHGGELANGQVVFWERKGDRLVLRGLAFDATAPKGSRIAESVKNSNETPILASLAIEGAGANRPAQAATPTQPAPAPKKWERVVWQPWPETPKAIPAAKIAPAAQTPPTAKADSTQSAPKNAKSKIVYRVKVTELFRGDNPAFSLSSHSRSDIKLAAYRADLSNIDSIRTFPINTEVSTTRTFMAQPGSKGAAAQTTGLMTFRLNTSFVLLPEEPMRARFIDPRVGFFTESFVDFNDDQHQVRRRRIATRWRLEPKDEDIEKMKRGELVEPKKPIVFYIDPATPKQWRPYLIAGVNDWQAAFEQAGFKNAIYALEWPENDPTMSLEDARFSVIRYLASSTPNAYGPHVSDPRSGEIIESHIGWYHNVMQLLHDWYMTQAAPIDARAQKMKFDEELMGQLIRFVSSHEVGHTLGLRHNMGSSSRTPVEKLRDKKWVETHGHTASIMDYARFNYVAQPEDNIDVAGIYPRINDYDKWAIEWGYKYFPDTQSAEEERLILNKITVDRLSKNNRLWFGGEGNENDPDAQTEDLGDDAMKASTYGLKNLRRLVKQLDKWTYEEGDLGQNLGQMYNSAVSQYRRYVGHVCRNIGGVHREYKSVEQSGPVFRPMERDRQRRALAWLKDNVVNCPTWMIDQPYVQRLSTSPEQLIRPLAGITVAHLFSPATINNIAQYAYGRQPYQPTEYVTDLLNTFFPQGEAKSSSWSRYLQQAAVQQLIKSHREVPSPEVRPYVMSLLTKIQQRLSTPSTDAATAAHNADLRQQIKRAFEAQ